MTALPAIYTPDTVAAHLGVSERNGAGTPQGSRHTTDTGSSRDVRGDMEDGMDDLKPCPFCGGRAMQNHPEQPHGGMVHCVSCGAEAFGPKWNRRAPTGVDTAMPERRGGE